MAQPESAQPPLDAEHAQLAAAARERRSVDSFKRAALEGFCWALLGGVCGQLLWDSVSPAPLFYPLVLLDRLLLWDAARTYGRGRGELRRDLLILRRLREVLMLLGIGPVSSARP